MLNDMTHEGHRIDKSKVGPITVHDEHVHTGMPDHL